MNNRFCLVRIYKISSLAVSLSQVFSWESKSRDKDGLITPDSVPMVFIVFSRDSKGDYNL